MAKGHSGNSDVRETGRIWGLVLYRYVILPNLRLWYNRIESKYTYILSRCPCIYCRAMLHATRLEISTISPGPKQHVKLVVRSKNDLLLER